MQTGQHQRIATIVFDPVAALFGNHRGSHYRTVKAPGCEVTVNLVSTWTGFIHEMGTITFADQFTNSFV
jgi:hypothetical protein